MVDTNRSRANGSQLKQMLTVVLAAILLVAAVYAVMQWQAGKPGTPVRDLRVSVTSAGETHEIAPYTVCELDEECGGGEPPVVKLDAQTVTVAVPEDIAASSWNLLMIYDDPAANDEIVYTSGEASEHEIEAVTATGARLVVAEVSALAVDLDSAGEETPVIATWSVGFE